MTYENYKKTFRSWLSIAEQGDAKAQHLLGLMYNEGKGVPQDYKEAVKWWRVAAEQGDEYAQRNLETMHGNSPN